MMQLQNMLLMLMNGMYCSRLSDDEDGGKRKKKKKGKKRQESSEDEDMRDDM
jgi:hypothetical protein